MNKEQQNGTNNVKEGSTASEIVKLLEFGLGETGKSYAIDKAIEQLYGEMDETFAFYDMQRGIDLEPLAFAKFCRHKRT